MQSKLCDINEWNHMLIKKQALQEQLMVKITGAHEAIKEKNEQMRDLVYQLYKEKGMDEYGAKYKMLYETHDWDGLAEHVESRMAGKGEAPATPQSPGRFTKAGTTKPEPRLP